MKTAIRVLKAHEVEITGTYSLATGQSSRPLPAEASAQAAPQVRIAQQLPQYAILEITCPCGHTMQVKCDYAQAQTTS